ncbi:MAG: GyrI-like domain-containing protein [Rhizobacter sp.]
MIETPQISHTKAQLTAFIHLTIARDEIQRVMGPGLSELRATLEAQGIQPTGPWFCHHLSLPATGWDFEISMPVESPVVASGRVKPGLRTAMRVARTVYHGPYEGLGDAWGEFLAWISASGHATGPDLYETYVTGPESSPDPTQWLTEFAKPLTG